VDSRSLDACVTRVRVRYVRRSRSLGRYRLLAVQDSPFVQSWWWVHGGCLPPLGSTEDDAGGHGKHLTRPGIACLPPPERSSGDRAMHLSRPCGLGLQSDVVPDPWTPLAEMNGSSLCMPPASPLLPSSPSRAMLSLAHSFTRQQRSRTDSAPGTRATRLFDPPVRRICHPHVLPRPPASNV
jgi:hypothetical protein